MGADSIVIFQPRGDNASHFILGGASSMPGHWNYRTTCTGNQAVVQATGADELPWLKACACHTPIALQPKYMSIATKLSTKKSPAASV